MAVEVEPLLDQALGASGTVAVAIVLASTPNAMRAVRWRGSQSITKVGYEAQ